MRISLLNRFQLYILLFAVKILWALDVLTGQVFEQSLKLSSYLATIIVSSGFLAGLVFSFNTGYLEKVVSGVFANIDSSTSLHTTSNVLGASATRKELPLLINQLPFPQVTAKAILIADKTHSKTLYEQNSHSRYASASTTKLMTALIALDIYQGNEEVTVSKGCAEIDSSKVGIPEGAVFKAQTLLNAMLISSAGDAACSLAEGKIGADEFLYLMNQKAYKLGLKSTFFTNAVGLDGENGSQFSSAQDLFKLANAAMENNQIREIVKTKGFTVNSFDEKFSAKIENTNRLLFEIPQTIGIKTGKTTEAGEVLIYEFKDDAKDLLIIVMGSQDRFSDVRNLLNWTLVSYGWDSVL